MKTIKKNNIEYIKRKDVIEKYKIDTKKLKGLIEEGLIRSTLSNNGEILCVKQDCDQHIAVNGFVDQEYLGEPLDVATINIKNKIVQLKNKETELAEKIRKTINKETIIEYIALFLSKIKNKLEKNDIEYYTKIVDETKKYKKKDEKIKAVREVIKKYNRNLLQIFISISEKVGEFLKNENGN